MASVFVWMNTVPANAWERSPAIVKARLETAYFDAAADGGVTILDTVRVQVAPSPSLPKGLLLATLSAPAHNG